MKKTIFSLIAILILFASCSSMPEGERLAMVNLQKEQASVLLDRGHSEYRWDYFDSAIHQYETAFTLAASVDWLEGMIRSLVQLSRSYDRTGDKERSGTYLNRAELLLTEADSTVLDVLVKNRKAEWLLFGGSNGDAMALSDDTITMLKEVDSEEAGEAWRIRAAILKADKLYDEADSAVDEALALDEKMNFIAEAASDYYIKASLASLKGNKDQSIELMFKALEKDKFIENSPAIAQDLYALGLIFEKNNITERAEHYFRRAHLVYEASGKDYPREKIEKKLNPTDTWSLD